MTIVKKLPAVLIAALGISCGFAGTALANPIFAEKTLGPNERLQIRPPNRSETTICYKATDNLTPSLFMISVANPRNPTSIFIPDDIEYKGLKVSQESDYKCITMNLGYVGLLTNVGNKELNESQSIHVYARQYTGN